MKASKTKKTSSALHHTPCSRFFVAQPGDPVKPHSDQQWTKWEVVDQRGQDRICLTSCQRKAELIRDALEAFHENKSKRPRCFPSTDCCDWEENEQGWWNTDCGNAFGFTDGSPIYNEFQRCPYCGKTLTETPYSEKDDSYANVQGEAQPPIKNL
jgi:hypothetical protein